MAEYSTILIVSAIASTMFLGGYQSPLDIFPPSIFWLMAKIGFFIFLLMWMRGTLPRFRYDQLMRFGWKVLLPLALLNIFLTAVGLILLGQSKGSVKNDQRTRADSKQIGRRARHPHARARLFDRGNCAEGNGHTRSEEHTS